MDVPQFLAATGMSMWRLSVASGVPYPSIYRHVKKGCGLAVESAQKLERFDARLSATQILGLTEKGAA